MPLTGGSGEAMLSLLGGRVEGYIGYGAAIGGQRAAGKVKVLAGFQKGKSEDFPEAVSAVDLGYKITLDTGNYVIAPKGLPPEVLQKLDRASQDVVRSPEFITFLRTQGFLADPKGPEETRAELVQYQKDFAELVAYIGKVELNGLKMEPSIQQGYGLSHVGGIGLLVSIGYLIMALQLPFGRLDQPGAGVFPVFVGAVLVLASLVTMQEGWSSSRGAVIEFPAGADRRRVISLVALLLGSFSHFPGSAS